MSEMTRKSIDLQLFADEGASAAASAEASNVSGTAPSQSTGTEGVDTGANGANAVAEQRLRDLGVPEDRARKRASKVADRMQISKVQAPTGTPTPSDAVTAAATEQMPAQVEERAMPKKPTWDEIKDDPDYNREISRIVSSRIKEARGAQDALSKMRPALEVMARKYSLDVNNMDWDALAQAINNDDAYYEDKAVEMGTTVETAKRVDQLERAEERRRAEESRSIQQRMLQEHFVRLENQASELKKIFPSFDLRTELNNKQFARMVSPGVNLSVKDAYYAIHHDEIQAASMRVAAERTAQGITASIAAGQRRPEESGTSAQASSTSQFDYRSASKQERDALKRRIREAAARGEKVYPGR